ncbi:MAG: DUF2089 family protein [Dictyoglomi bacterium]|nr:DUF2089 family protein [Dictyoglomota bacterium]
MNIPKCPVCGGTMQVTELYCPRDGITIRGTFELSPLATLSKEDAELVILFLRARGNLKKLERITGIGYFALRGKIEKIVKSMGLTLLAEEEEETPEEEKDDPIKLLKEGKISVDEAIRRMKKS